MNSPAAPDGLVTLVFTDLQGSTELWEKLGAAFQPVLDRHHRILRERLAARDGWEVKTEGDAFMIAFARAADALAFALESQEALHAEPWPAATGELLVRMGLHAGEPLRITDSATGRPDYYGPAVNRAARVAAAAHGGQILLSAAAWDLAGESRAAAAAADLGEHRLKGLERPERLWQALPKSLASRTFPPPKTLSARPTNLPAPATSFVGRARELEELAALARDPAARLVTLTGPGGAGKTRLALRLAADLLGDFEGGAWFADLSDARDAAAVARVAARALGVPVAENEPAEERVAAALELRRPLLLVLDNFEQALDAAPATVGLWRSRAPAARFLVTSRSLLGLAGEREFEVPPLGLPPAGASRQTARLEAFDGVRLFLERARDADPRFQPDPALLPAVAELCARLDGIPLAIELAAARLRVIRPADMLARLDQRFQVLRSTRRDLPPRQQTLLGAIDWSYDLLVPWERAAFQQACVFRGGFFLEDAEAVLALPPDAPDPVTAMQTLREKSFLRTWETPYGLRFGMYESLREYGERKWAEAAPAEEREGLLARHAARVLGPAPAADGEPERGLVDDELARLEVDAENVRAVHRRAVERGRADDACRAAGRLAPVLLARGPHAELRVLLESALALAGDARAPSRLEAALFLAADLGRTGERARGREVAAEVERRAGEAGLKRLAARAALARIGLGGTAADREAARAELHALRGMFQGLGDISGAVRTLVAEARLEAAADVRRALSLLDEAERLAAGGGSPFVALPVLMERVSCYDSLGESVRGLEDLDRAEALLRRMGERTRLADVLLHRGRLLGFVGRPEGTRCLEEAEQIFRDTGAQVQLARCLGSHGGFLLNGREFDGARAKLEAAELILRRLGEAALLSGVLAVKGVLLCRQERWVEAEAVLREAAEVAGAGKANAQRGQAHAYLADLKIAQSQWAEALPPIEAAIADFQAIGFLRMVGPSRIARGLVLLELGRAAEAAAEEEAGLREIVALGQGGSEVATRARLYLGRARAALGDRAGARELLETARREVAGIEREAPAVAAALRPLVDRLAAAAGD